MGTDGESKLYLSRSEHHKLLIEEFEKYLEMGSFVDCILSAEGLYLYAHKIILAACSSYFNSLFSTCYEQCPIVVLKDVQFEDLHAIIEFIYRGEVYIEPERSKSFLDAAASLEIIGMTEMKDLLEKEGFLDAEESENDKKLPLEESKEQVNDLLKFETTPKESYSVNDKLSQTEGHCQNIQRRRTAKVVTSRKSSISRMCPRLKRRLNQFKLSEKISLKQLASEPMLAVLKHELQKQFENYDTKKIGNSCSSLASILKRPASEPLLVALNHEIEESFQQLFRARECEPQSELTSELVPVPKTIPASTLLALKRALRKIKRTRRNPSNVTYSQENDSEMSPEEPEKGTEDLYNSSRNSDGIRSSTVRCFNNNILEEAGINKSPRKEDACSQDVFFSSRLPPSLSTPEGCSENTFKGDCCPEKGWKTQDLPDTAKFSPTVSIPEECDGLDEATLGTKWEKEAYISHPNNECSSKRDVTLYDLEDLPSYQEVLLMSDKNILCHEIQDSPTSARFTPKTSLPDDCHNVVSQRKCPETLWLSEVNVTELSSQDIPISSKLTPTTSNPDDPSNFIDKYQCPDTLWVREPKISLSNNEMDTQTTCTSSEGSISDTQLCDEVYSEAEDLDNDVTSNKSCLTCWNCTRQFKSRSDLLEHMKTDCGNTSRKYVCQYCQKVFRRDVSLANHIKYFHMDGVNRSSKSEEYNTEEDRNEEYTSSFQCERCGRVYMWSRTDKNAPFKCPFCQKNSDIDHSSNHQRSFLNEGR